MRVRFFVQRCMTAFAIVLLSVLLATAATGCGLQGPVLPEIPDGEITQPVRPSDGEEKDPTESGNPTDPSKPSEGEQPTEPPLWAQTYALPQADDVTAKLLAIYGGEEKLFLLQSGRILRMPCPENGQSMVLNFTFDMGKYAKMLIEDSIQEFNDVFRVVNPNYTFVANYAPTEEDLKSKYSIRVSRVASFSRPNTLGTAAHSYVGDSICNFSIQLRNDVLDDGSEILSVFKHELMHLLGAGDAYNNEQATRDTIMQGYSVGGPFCFSESDVAFLDAMYRNPQNRYSDEYIADYIDGYAENNRHTYAVNQAAVYHDMIGNLPAEELQAQVRAAEYVDGQTDGVLAALADGFTIDAAFGKSNVSFTELTPTVEGEGTVYYSGSFDVAEGRYWHGTRKYGSNLSSSMGIGYTDYGDGILFAMPNGTANPTFFVRVQNYVFALHREGGFTALGVLNATVLRVYTV